MYGTLEKKVDPSIDNFDGSTATNAANSNNQNNTNRQQQQHHLATSFNNQDQENRRRKRIYSHCHVQSNDSGDKRQPVDKSARRRLIAASIICLVFMIGEVVGGVLSNSLAIATDAAHLLTDFASFMISLFAIWLSSRPASKKMSFGWYRAEVIGALLSVLMIWLVTGLLVYMAIERLRTGVIEIDSVVMVITASAGLLVNIIMAIALNVDGGHGHSHGFHSHGGGGHGHSHGFHNHNHLDHLDDCDDDDHGHRLETSTTNNMTFQVGDRFEPATSNGSHATITVNSAHNHTKNQQQDNGIHNHKGGSNNKSNNESGRGRGKKNINVRAAFIHVIGDFLQSLGVLIAALVIHFKPEYSIVDPICTFVFSIIVLITTINIIRDATNVLMEGIPDGINFIEVRERLQSLPSVIRVHNLRIWSLSLDKIALSTHLVIDNSRQPSQVLKEAIDLLKNSYNLFETTIQIEEYKDDMRDCEHCQDEEVVVNVVSNGGGAGNNPQQQKSNCSINSSGGGGAGGTDALA